MADLNLHRKMNPSVNYHWKLKVLAKGVDPSIAAEELQRIQELYGKISPEIIVSEASNPGSVLHPFFEWDNTKAAFNYRLQQARILLNNIHLTVISDGEAKEVAVFEVISIRDGYKSVDILTPDNISFIKAGILKQLEYLKAKLKLYKEFAEVMELINQAIEKIEK